MDFTRLADNIHYVSAALLFLIGLYIVAIKPNLIKKIMGINIMETSVFLFLVAQGMVEGGHAPVAAKGIEAMEMVNPIPQALILTGIVVAVSTTAVALSICIKIHDTYGTLDAFELRGRE